MNNLILVFLLILASPSIFATTIQCKYDNSRTDELVIDFEGAIYDKGAPVGEFTRGFSDVITKIEDGDSATVEPAKLLYRRNDTRDCSNCYNVQIKSFTDVYVLNLKVRFLETAPLMIMTKIAGMSYIQKGNSGIDSVDCEVVKKR